MGPKKGRPHVENPKSQQYRIRLSEEEVKKLEYCCEQTGRTKADILRDGLEKIYRELKK